MFLGSCPETPRHGVIESIKCDDEQSLYENFEQLSNKMKEVDPNGCMITMPFINATSSAVIAPSVISRIVMKTMQVSIPTSGSMGMLSLVLNMMVLQQVMVFN